MKFTYFLFLLTFWGYPIIAGVVISYFGDANFSQGNARIRKYIAVSIPFFLLFDAACYSGYSFSGDYADYFIFSLQYFVICLLVEGIKHSRNIWLEVLRIGGYLILVSGALIGLFGMLTALPLTNGYCDKEFRLKSHNHTYVLRRYSDFELAPSAIFYTFSLYRKFGFLPIEKFVRENKGADQAVDQPLEPIIRIIDSSKNRQYLYVKPETDTAIITEIE